MAGVRKSRNPAALIESRVPAGMVNVQVRHQHIIDGFRFDSDRLETLQVRRPELVEIGGVRPALMIPDAGVDQEDPAILANHQV